MRTLSVLAKQRAVRFFEERLAYTLGPAELDHARKERTDLIIVDVRAPEAYLKGHIPSAVNLPRERWNTFEGLDKAKDHVLYCYTQQCHLAPEACLKFARAGYRVRELEGGWQAWREYALDVEGEAGGRRAA
jgi:rhodanese-related sulfurtransferase